MSDAQVEVIAGLRIELEDAQKALAARDARVAELERDGCRGRADAAEATLAKSQAEAAVMREALVAITSDFAPEHIDKMGSLNGGTLARTALASGAGQPLLDELESLRKRVAELERTIDRKDWVLKRIDEELALAGTPLQWTDGGGSAAPHGWHRNPFLNIGHQPTVWAERDSLKAQLAASEGHRLALREALEHEKKRADAEANDTFCSCNMQGEPCDDCFRLGMRIAHLGRALASPLPQPTHWVPRGQVEKLDAEVATLKLKLDAESQRNDDRAGEVVELKAEVAAMAPVEAALKGLRDAVSMRLARGEDTTPGDFERAWKAACDALDARAPVSPTWPLVLEFARRMEAKLEKNRHKGNREGWLKYSADDLWARLKEESVELLTALHDGSGAEKVADEAADVANFAMMIADVALDARKGGG